LGQTFLFEGTQGVGNSGNEELLVSLSNNTLSAETLGNDSSGNGREARAFGCRKVCLPGPVNA